MAKSSLALTLGNISIRQLDGLFSLNDLHAAAGGAKRHQPSDFFRIEQTQALIAEINSTDSQNLSSADSRSLAFKTVVGKGKAQGTYACRELVIAYAAWISAAFHLKVIRVFLDSVQPDIERISYSVGATDTLSAAQAEQLRLIFKNKCATLPEGEQAAFMIQGWSKLKSHFGVAYRKIEQREFHEALSLATRHAAEWTNSKALKPPVSMAALPAPEPVTAATLVSLLMGDCLSERAVLDIALAASVTLFKKAVSKPNGFGDQVARKIDRRLPQADLHAILVAASMEMNMRVVVAKMELEKVE